MHMKIQNGKKQRTNAITIVKEVNLSRRYFSGKMNWKEARGVPQLLIKEYENLNGRMWNILKYHTRSCIPGLKYDWKKTWAGGGGGERTSNHSIPTKETFQIKTTLRSLCDVLHTNTQNFKGTLIGVAFWQNRSRDTGKTAPHSIQVNLLTFKASITIIFYFEQKNLKLQSDPCFQFALSFNHIPFVFSFLFLFLSLSLFLFMHHGTRVSTPANGFIILFHRIRKLGAKLFRFCGKTHFIYHNRCTDESLQQQSFKAYTTWQVETF